MWAIDRHPACGQSAVVVDRRGVHAVDESARAAEIARALSERCEAVTNNVSDGWLGLETNNADVLNLVVREAHPKLPGAARTEGKAIHHIELDGNPSCGRDLEVNG